MEDTDVNRFILLIAEMPLTSSFNIDSSFYKKSDTDNNIIFLLLNQVINLYDEDGWALKQDWILELK